MSGSPKVEVKAHKSFADAVSEKRLSKELENAVKADSVAIISASEQPTAEPTRPSVRRPR